MSGNVRRLRYLHEAVRFALPQRNAILLIVALTALMAAANAAEPLALKWIFDRLGAGQAGLPLLRGFAVLAGLAILREAARGVSDWLSWRTRIGLQYALLEATIGKLHNMPLRLQRSEGVGAIMTRLDRSIQGFVGAATQLLLNVFPSIVFLAMSIWIMLGLDWRLALLVFVFAPLPALIAAYATPEQISRERKLLDQWSRIYSRFNEVLSGILIVRSFTMEEVEKKKFLADVNEANQIVIRGVATDTGYGSASNIVIAVARLAAIGLGSYLVIRGEITVGTVVAFLGYVGGLFGPVQGLSATYQTVGKASVSLDEILRIIDVQEYLGDSPQAVELSEVRGDVEFRNVRFRYEHAGAPLLDGIDLAVRAGETVAIVGPSGSGKTTLMAVLMRFYDPQEGSVHIDGHDLRSIKQSSIRRNIGVVLQDPLLFNDTVRANIAYARPTASLQEVEAAARAASAHEMIMRMPEGYNSLVGERGSLLSAGERQRITIARAILKDAPILVLDEATASLDAESEQAVQDAIETLMRGRTTFIIAHRLATVINAHRIIVLKDGRIIESGRHDTLMRLKGYYASLVHRQQRGLIQNDATGVTVGPQALAS